MLYSGHFSFDEIDEFDNERHGYFTFVVSAATPELALQKFRQRIYTIREDLQEPFFQSIRAIYVEDIVEIFDSPEDAVMTRFQSSEGPFPRSVSCSLPTTKFKDIKAFQWIPESDLSEKRAPADGESEYKEAVPFIWFS